MNVKLIKSVFFFAIHIFTCLCQVDGEFSNGSEAITEVEERYPDDKLVASSGNGNGDGGGFPMEEDVSESGGSRETPILSRGCPADHVLPCIPKCCDVHESYGSSNECIPSPDYFFPEFLDCPNHTDYYRNISVEKRYEYFIGDPCLKQKCASLPCPISDGFGTRNTNGVCRGMVSAEDIRSRVECAAEIFLLDVVQYPDDEHYLYSNGTLWYADNYYTMEEFCVESVNGTPRVFMCFENEKLPGFKFLLYPIGLLISIPFLIITAAVYLGFESLRDTQGKALACHVFCLAFAYCFLALVQLASQELDNEVCIAAAFIIQFFFVACFVWLNVLCFDTWRNICTDYRDSISRPKSKWERYKFLVYSAYGWHAPFLLTIVSLIMDLEPTIPESYLKPKFGFRSCWFQSEAAALPYFYGPISVLIFINLIFFVLSARKIYLDQKKYVRLNRTNYQMDTPDAAVPGKIKMYIRALKQCFSLFCVMGINWAAEVISWIIGGSDLIWLVTDIVNTLQGLIIFYIFVIKPKYVRNEVIQKLRSCSSSMCSMCDKGRKRSKTGLYMETPQEEDEDRSAFKCPKEKNIRFIDASVTSLTNL